MFSIHISDVIILLQKNYKCSSAKELIILSILVTTVILSIYYLGNVFITGFAKVLSYDSLIYYNMSYAPFQSTIAPYMYRILTPFLVYIFPFKHIISFTWINLTALFLTAVLLYYYLKKLKFNQFHSFTGVLIFLLSPTIIYSMYYISLIDFLSFLFFLLAFYAILCKNDKLYLVALIFGILNKETILFTIPLYFLFRLDDNKLYEAFKSTVKMAVIPLMLFLGIRYYFGFTGYFSLITIKETLLYITQAGTILVNPYLAFGTLWIISLYNIQFVKSTFLKKSLYILPFIFLQVLIATDIFRALFIAFPIIIPIGLYLFKIKNNKIITVFMGLSFFVIWTYLLIIPPNGRLLALLMLPSEILIFCVLMVHYLSINGILKNILSKINIPIHPRDHGG